VISRRTFLTGTVAAGALIAAGPVAAQASTTRPRLRRPGSVPDPSRPAGTHDPTTPIEHIVIVMQENHSFDEYLGMLPRRGQPRADGFSFDRHGRPTNANPRTDGRLQVAFRRRNYCPGNSAGQSWNSTHLSVNHGRMDGFARLDPSSMGYFDEPDIPFYYSLAKTFTLANRWFASAPAQTYPNRRFLYAGTAQGTISTDNSNFTLPPPAAGSIQDSLIRHGLTWRDYVTDLPDTAIVPSNIERYPQCYTSIAQFYTDCALGTLPAVSYVESDGGVPGVVGGPLADALASTKVPLPPAVQTALYQFQAAGGDEEGDDVRIGEAFVSRVVRAVMASPAWERTLLIWCYDEHGGYYDHVPPPAAIAPDAIRPRLSRGDQPRGYDMYGVRVPAVVVSPWSRPHAVTNVVHDHTSILAEIERTWNLPSLTWRDANATGLRDFLDFRHPALLKPPRLAAPGSAHLSGCAPGT
jgi:phospholipase C